MQNSPDNGYNVEQCLADLKAPDPRLEKKRTELSKDKLLKDSYAWILNNQAFMDWQANHNTRLLWIKGDPGKGKTMMMIGLVDQLSSQLQANPGSHIMSYFFCQDTDPRLNNAVSVLKGLIYFLTTEHEDLIQHIRKRYETAGSQQYEGASALLALWTILMDMVNDPRLIRVYLMIDALDECDFELSQLLDLINSEPSSKVKWLVASRGKPDIEEQLRPDNLHSKISLELNSSHISSAVDAFINVKVHELASRKKYDDKLREEVRSYLQDNAGGTFLWVALVCRRFETYLYHLFIQGQFLKPSQR